MTTSLFGSSTTGSTTNPKPLTLSGSGAFAATVQSTAQGNAATALNTISTTNGATDAATTGFATANQNLCTITDVALNADGTAATGATAAIMSINILADGNGSFKFTDQNGNALSSGAAALFTITAGTGTLRAGDTVAFTAGGALGSTAPTGFSTANELASRAGIATANATNNPVAVSSIDLTKANGAKVAIESIDNALNTVNSIQAGLGAAQNRFSSIAATQQAQSTNLSSAQLQITDANFAQETANLSRRLRCCNKLLSRCWLRRTRCRSRF
ncbi:MAG: Flagellin FliC [uncultured Caballeronia sp.]|nr:MAG: Flagellin FliC [uncultured Caballeronia sp.]